MRLLPLLLLVACSRPADDVDDPDLDKGADPGCEARHDAFIAALEADLEANGIPGVSAAILEDGEITCRVARGVTEAGGDTPVGVDTLFQLGSTTKVFTSIALLQQVEAGAVDLDTTLIEAYPEAVFALDPTWSERITMHHLISNQGAFFDWFDWNANSADAALASWHENVFFPNLWLMNEPGAFFNYSNPNFNLAGLVAEHTDGRRYPDLMADEVFGALGMDRTFQRKADAVADGDFALGYGLRIVDGSAVEGPVAVEHVPDPASARPAGAGTWSTPDQVLHLARFLTQGDESVLSDDLRREIVAPHAPFPGYEPFGLAYGYGMMVSPGLLLDDQWVPVEVWQHNGNTLSYSSEFVVVPERDFAISVLSSGWSTDFSESVATALRTLADLPDAEPRPTFPFDPAGLDRHVGTYDDPFNVGEIIITRVGDGLNVSMPYLASLGMAVGAALHPLSTDLWVLTIDGAPYVVAFVAEGEGLPSTWIANRSFVGTREGATMSLASPRLPGFVTDRRLPMPGPGHRAVTAPDR